MMRVPLRHLFNARRRPAMRNTMHPAALLAAVFATLLLAGCPLFGGKDKSGAATGKSTNPAFDVVLEGEGVSETGPLAYRVDLASNVGTGQPVKLSATLDGKPLTLAQPATSSAPDVVRVDGPQQLTALKAGDARITVVHRDDRAEVAVEVKEADETVDSFKVVSSSLRDIKGPVDAFTTDNYKHGNGGMANVPKVWVTILGLDGKPIRPEQCWWFGATVTPETLPSGWEADDRGFDGMITIKDVNLGYDHSKAGIKGCSYVINGRGFPIIGTGVQEFELAIHWNCMSKSQLPECGSPGYPACEMQPRPGVCGKPLPGGVVKFGIKRQGRDECEYCEGR